MPDPERTIQELYAALDRGDGAAMERLYAPGATFRDPAFGALEGPQVGAMWRMLTGRSSGLDVTLAEHTASTAHWIARYRFGDAQRPVTNDVRASFTFAADGRIATHEDRFDLRAWAAQAMGPVPAQLGRTPLLGLLVRRRARGQLAAFQAREGSAA